MHTSDSVSAHPTVERTCDVAVVGGSAAGLAAALQLARQRRAVIVVDDGTPRNAPEAHMHGYLGREGMAPAEFVEAGRGEVRSHGGEVLQGRAVRVRAENDGGFTVDLTGGYSLRARRVLMATGIADELPDIEGLAEGWGRGVIHCPFFHGFEVRDRRLVQIVTHPMGLHPTPLLHHLTDRITVVLHDLEGVDESVVDSLSRAGVPIVRKRVRRVLTGSAGAVVGVELADGRTIGADAVLVGPRFRARVDALALTGVATTPHASGLGDVLEVDDNGQTRVPGLYAAGDLTDPGMQVLQAAAHGSRVGAMIAFSLADEDLHAGTRVFGGEADWDHRYAADQQMWSANPNGTMVREVTDLAPGRALDVGAGEGADALWLAERGWDVTACDISRTALARIDAEAGRRRLTVRTLHVDANAPDAFPSGTYDLVSAQYASILRTPDQRGLRNLLDAVAPGGTILVVGHDLTPLRAPVDAREDTHIFDPDAYLGVEELATALAASDAFELDVHETRSRPPGAVSAHHVNDVVLRATRMR